MHVGCEDLLNVGVRFVGAGSVRYVGSVVQVEVRLVVPENTAKPNLVTMAMSGTRVLAPPNNIPRHGA